MMRLISQENLMRIYSFTGAQKFKKNENTVQRKGGKAWIQVQVNRQLQKKSTYRGIAKTETYGGFVFPAILI